MLRLTYVLLLLVIPILQGCSKAPPEERKTTALEKQLDIQTEVLHQTREVLRYVEEQHRLEENQTQTLAIDTATMVPTEEQHQKQNQNQRPDE